MATSRGDAGIWREAGGGTNYDSASWVDYALDTEVLAEGDFGQSGGSSETDFEMPEGHVLVMGNVSFAGDSGNDHAAPYIGFELDGADIIYGRGSGKIRDVTSAFDECPVFGAAILDVDSTGDILTLRTKRIDTNTGGGLIDDKADSSGLQCVKLDDNRGYFRATRSTDKDTAGIVHGEPISIADLNASSDWEEADWDSPDEEGRGFSLTGGAGTSEIIIPVGARILLTCGVEFQLKTSAERRGCHTRVQRRDGSGGSWTTVTNSHSLAYLRNKVSQKSAWASHISILDLTGLSDPRIRIQFIEEQETDAADCKTIAAYITIGELPDAADYMYINTDAAETTWTNTFTSTTFEAVPTEMDADSFAYPAATTMQLRLAEKYLIVGQFTTERSATSNYRKYPEIRWHMNAALTKRGYFGGYNRGYSIKGQWITGAAGGLIHSASVDDLLLIKHGCNYDNNSRNLQAPTGYISIQAINLTDSFSIHSEGTVTDSVTAQKAALIGSIVGFMTSSCSAGDSTRGGLVVADSVKARARLQVDNYASLSDVRVDEPIYRFHSGQRTKQLVPLKDISVDNEFTIVTDSTAWQALDGDVDDYTAVNNYVDWDGISPAGNLGMQYTALPGDFGEVIGAKLRVRLDVTGPFGGFKPDDFTKIMLFLELGGVNYFGLSPEIGTITNEIVETEIVSFASSIIDLNSTTCYFKFFDNIPLNDARFYAVDIIITGEGGEKEISTESFSPKGSPSNSFSSGKDIGGETWDEKGPSSGFDPS